METWCCLCAHYSCVDRSATQSDAANVNEDIVRGFYLVPGRSLVRPTRPSRETQSVLVVYQSVLFSDKPYPAGINLGELSMKT